MSLDALFLTFLTRELNEKLVGSRVDKIFMPSRDESVFVMRGRERHKLLINVSTNSPRLSLTDSDPENPKIPPAFCMLLRKHFSGGRVERVYMPDFERCIRFDFECKNDFFEPVQKSMVLELTGRSANMILLDSDDRIIDAMRKLDLSSGSGRCILPTARYTPPPAQAGKTPILDITDVSVFFENPELTLERAIMNGACGMSPLVAREIAYRAALGSEKRVKTLGKSDMDRLRIEIEKIKDMCRTGECKTVIIKDREGKPIDFCFMPVSQYGDYGTCTECVSPSAAIEMFFGEGTRKARLEQKTGDLSKLILRTSARITKRVALREKELENAGRADHYRICGELINANLYRMKNGQTALVTENYFDGCREIKIPLSPALSPVQNAQQYFKKYTKARNSADILRDLIAKDREELSYLDSVFLAVCDCENATEAEEIRRELVSGGYIRRRAAKYAEKESRPREFEKDGFTIYVGKNNTQNDYVTVKLSRKNDIWLHTKNVHSSHVLISCKGKTPPDSVIEYAAGLCAYYSKAREDTKVEVDYCPVQNVKKPVGARPGMAVYDVYNTVVVQPLKEEKNA